MSETIAALALSSAYLLLWRHAIVKGRRFRADAARARRLGRIPVDPFAVTWPDAVIWPVGAPFVLTGPDVVTIDVHGIARGL